MCARPSWQKNCCVFGGSHKNVSFSTCQTMCSCRFAWQAWHFLTFDVFQETCVCTAVVGLKLPCLWGKPQKRTLHSTLYTPHSTFYTPQSTHYTPHTTLHISHSTLYTPHSALHTLRSTLHTLLFRHVTSHSTLYIHTLHSTLHTLHCTSHSTLYTSHSTL